MSNSKPAEDQPSTEHRKDGSDTGSKKAMLGGFMVKGATNEAMEWSTEDVVFRESIRLLIQRSCGFSVDDGAENTLQRLAEQAQTEESKAAILQIITLLRDCRYAANWEPVLDVMESTIPRIITILRGGSSQFGAPKLSEQAEL